jgi:uncharacterized protein YbdZ (MbtH family)
MADLVDIRRNFRLWPELTQIQQGWKVFSQDAQDPLTFFEKETW